MSTDFFYDVYFFELATGKVSKMHSSSNSSHVNALLQVTCEVLADKSVAFGGLVNYYDGLRAVQIMGLCLHTSPHR